MGLIELFELGFFDAFWNFSNVYLSIANYFCVLLGFGIQFLLIKKCRKKVFRWTLVGICVVGILLSECAFQAITGWDRLLVDFIYGFFVCILLGALISLGVSVIKNKKTKK